MQFEVAPPPSNIPDEPDTYTQAAPDYSHPKPAPNRILHIDTKYFRYGTADKAHAAALCLSASLLVSAVIIAIIGGCIEASSHSDPKWLDTLVTWIGNGFLFTAGIAVGRSKSKHSEDE